MFTNSGTNMLIDTASHPICAPLYPPVLRPHVFYSIALMLRFIVRRRLDAGLTAWHHDPHASANFRLQKPPRYGRAGCFDHENGKAWGRRILRRPEAHYTSGEPSDARSCAKLYR